METSLPDIASILFFLTFAVYAVLVMFILVWMHQDAENRGIRGLLVVLPAFMTGTLPGMVLWLAFRPSLKPEPVLVRVRND
ncbi:hypothetical protein H9Q13_00195 [Pontibacter sp. JH31]|uniref:Phospholipase_D-nuclease N-terminal n=1 Tax=Pontibacter aquaedesilientis TaxID=2766980 RepID=A0ABR7XB87_9BACT|nr:hypothetical protein [Pontibacter aquaedesilientis]MBD1395571.1 hypothetical protein [Pontibacter aquaedesilientis]